MTKFSQDTRLVLELVFKQFLQTKDINQVIEDMENIVSYQLVEEQGK